jgi:hypothetical protein
VRSPATTPHSRPPSTSASLASPAVRDVARHGFTRHRAPERYRQHVSTRTWGSARVAPGARIAWCERACSSLVWSASAHKVWRGGCSERMQALTGVAGRGQVDFARPQLVRTTKQCACVRRTQHAVKRARFGGGIGEIRTPALLTSTCTGMLPTLCTKARTEASELMSATAVGSDVRRERGTQ